MNGKGAFLALDAMFVALCALLAQVMLPLPPVPANLTLLAVHLCALMLPLKHTLAVVAAYLLLGALGVPVFAGMAGGPGVLMGPTGGYLLGYLPCGAVTCLIQKRMHPMAAMALGTLGCYMLGTAWFMGMTGTALLSALMTCVIPFVLADAGKIVLAHLLSRRLRSAWKGGGHPI